MDVFKEYIVKRELTSGENISKIFIIVASVALAFFFIAMTFSTTLMLFGFVFAALSVYIGYQVIARMFVEYEYILTNADLDIDKITNQSKRKRLCTVNLRTVTACGKFTDSVSVGGDETLVKAGANNPELNDYYLRFNHKEYGKAILVFTPSAEVVDLIKPFIPRNAENNL
jgi:hypothetical protein